MKILVAICILAVGFGCGGEQKTEAEGAGSEALEKAESEVKMVELDMCADPPLHNVAFQDLEGQAGCMAMKKLAIYTWKDSGKLITAKATCSNTDENPIYTGQIVNGREHGKWKIISAGGLLTREGECKNGHAEGKFKNVIVGEKLEWIFKDGVDTQAEEKSKAATLKACGCLKPGRTFDAIQLCVELAGKQEKRAVEYVSKEKKEEIRKAMLKIGQDCFKTE